QRTSGSWSAAVVASSRCPAVGRARRRGSTSRRARVAVSDGFAPVNTDPFTPEARHIAVVAGGLGDPSSTRLLADRLTEAATAALSQEGIVPEVHVIELRELATAISDALVTHNNSPALADAIDQVEQADGIITTTPTFKATYSGLFKSFWDLVDDP